MDQFALVMTITLLTNVLLPLKLVLHLDHLHSLLVTCPRLTFITHPHCQSHLFFLHRLLHGMMMHLLRLLTIHYSAHRLIQELIINHHLHLPHLIHSQLTISFSTTLLFLLWFPHTSCSTRTHSSPMLSQLFPHPSFQSMKHVLML